MRRLADELDADAVQEQVELLEVEGAVAVVVDVLDEVVDLRWTMLAAHKCSATLENKVRGPTEMDGASVGLS